MNIFARELAQVLASHHKELSSLYTIKSPTLSMPPGKVTRLKRSLTEDHTATLNADELELLREQIPLADEEMRRLRASLVAETVRYVLVGRMPTIHLAAEIAELSFQLLVAADGQKMEVMRDQLLEQIRGNEAFAELGRTGLPGMESQLSGRVDPAEDPVGRALDAAAWAYEDGALWLEMARGTADRGARLGYLGQAKSLLTRARTLTIHPATVVLGSSQQAELLALIDAALADADSLG